MCRASGNKKDTTLVDGGASISPEELGRAFLDYILRDGWIDIAGQCANTMCQEWGLWDVRYVGGEYVW